MNFAENLICNDGPIQKKIQRGKLFINKPQECNTRQKQCEKFHNSFPDAFLSFNNVWTMVMLSKLWDISQRVFGATQGALKDAVLGIRVRIMRIRIMRIMKHVL